MNNQLAWHVNGRVEVIAKLPYLWCPDNAVYVSKPIPDGRMPRWWRRWRAMRQVRWAARRMEQGKVIIRGDNLTISGRSIHDTSGATITYPSNVTKGPDGRAVAEWAGTPKFHGNVFRTTAGGEP